MEGLPTSKCADCGGDRDTESARCGVGCDRGEETSVNERAREKERDERETNRSERRFGVPEVARSAPSGSCGESREKMGGRKKVEGEVGRWEVEVTLAP